MVGLVLTRGCICSIDFLVLCHCGGKCRLRISIIEGELCFRRDFNTGGCILFVGVVVDGYRRLHSEGSQWWEGPNSR